MLPIPSRRPVRRLQERLFALLIAVCTEAMRRLATGHRRLQNVGERSGIVAFQFVAILLTFPVFQLHNFLFKLAYRLGSIRLRDTCRRQRLLGLDNVLSERDLDLIDRRCLSGSVEALQSVKGKFETLRST